MLLLSASGCGENEKAAAPSAEATTALSGVVRLDKAQQKRLGIVLTSVRSRTARATIPGVGWYVAPPTSETVIRTPVPGFAMPSSNEAWPNLGQDVVAGEMLAAVNVFLSPQEVSQLVQAKEDTDIQMQQSLVTMQLTEAQLKLASTARDAITGVRLDQLKEGYERSKIAYREAQEKLPFLIREPYEDGALMKPVNIRVPKAGRVLQMHVSPEQFVQAGDPLWTVADWSTLWLRVPVFEHDLAFIERNEVAEIRGRQVSETITASPVVLPVETKPGTRTIDLFYSVSNPRWTLRVGQSTAVELPVQGERDVQVIPNSAILYDGFGQAFCYVADGDKTGFRRTQIELGFRRQDGVVVRRGLNQADTVVAVGAEMLSAEESKTDLAVEDND